MHFGKYFLSRTWNDRKTGRLDGIMVAEVQTTHFGKFALEDIALVQEEDDQHAEEPPRVDNNLEEDERFSHPVLWYEQNCQRKEGGGKRGVDSLFSTPPKGPGRTRSEQYKKWYLWRSRNNGSTFPLRSLTPQRRTCIFCMAERNVPASKLHPSAWKGNARELIHVKPRLCNTRALLSRAQYIRLGWDTALFPDSQSLVKETVEKQVVSFLDWGYTWRGRMTASPRARILTSPEWRVPDDRDIRNRALPPAPAPQNA